MADRNFRPTFANGTKHVRVAFTFFPQGSAASCVLGEGANGWVSSVTHSGSGAYTILMSDKYNALVAAKADIAASAVVDLNAQWGAVDVSSAKTIVLNVLAAGVGTDISAAAGNFVMVDLTLRNSMVTP